MSRLQAGFRQWIRRRLLSVRVLWSEALLFLSGALPERVLRRAFLLLRVSIVCVCPCLYLLLHFKISILLLYTPESMRLFADHCFSPHGFSYILSYFSGFVTICKQHNLQIARGICDKTVTHNCYIFTIQLWLAAKGSGSVVRSYYNTDSASCVRNYKFVIPENVNRLRLRLRSRFSASFILPWAAFCAATWAVQRRGAQLTGQLLCYAEGFWPQSTYSVSVTSS